MALLEIDRVETSYGLSQVLFGVSLTLEAGQVVALEQNVDFVLSLSDRLYILEKGQVRFRGTPDDVRGNDTLLKYLTV